MNKKSIIIVVIVAAVIVGLAAVLFLVPKSDTKNSQTSLNINSAQDLESLLNQIYEGQENLFPSIETMEIDVSDASTIKSMTGLENGDDLEYVIVSEPMISSQAYSLVMAKVKDGVDVDKVTNSMFKGVDPRKWICVTAQKIYATSSGNIAFLVMSDEEIAKPVYDKFKEIAGSVGKEYTETVSETLPDDDPLMSIPN